MNTWFKTKNDQILDLRNLQAFWIEEVYLEKKVFCEDNDKIQWQIAEFEKIEDAKSYLIEIFEMLKVVGVNN